MTDGLRTIIIICLMVAPAVNAEQSTTQIDRMREVFGIFRESHEYNGTQDLNRDGRIDGADLSILSAQLLSSDKNVSGALFNPDHILVKFRTDISPSDVNELVTERNSKLLRKTSSLNGYSVLAVPAGMTPEQFVSTVSQISDVVSAQLDYICYAHSIPNDPYYSYQWHFKQIRAPYAWDLTSGGDNSIQIAVLDTGVAYEDFQGYRQAPDFAQTRFSPGYDFVNDDDHPNDDEGHGTHVSGTIAQSTNNHLGVAGLAYNCTIMPVKVLDSEGVGDSMSLSEGITYAVDHGADVINMSLGFPVGSDPGSIIANAMAYAFERGVICVASAGNDADSPGYRGGISYPAAYDECIAVGAVRFDQSRSYYSNYGNTLDCVAPGGDMRVDQNKDNNGDGVLQQTFINHNYENFEFYFFQGTSMASPHVAAAAALFKSRNGGGPSEFAEALRETCTDLGSYGYDREYGWGLIDLPAIIKKAKAWGANN